MTVFAMSHAFPPFFEANMRMPAIAFATSMQRVSIFKNLTASDVNIDAIVNLLSLIIYIEISKKMLSLWLSIVITIVCLKSRKMVYNSFKEKK